MKALLLSIIVAYPILLFLWKVRNQRRAYTAGDYFLAGKTIESGPFIDSSVAYAYQIAALSLFATWGYTYGLWTLWVPIFWALGFFLLRYLLVNGYLDSFMNQKIELTLHGFLAEAHQYRPLARMSALLSILGLSGTAFFEAEFTGSILGSALGNDALGDLAFMAFVLVVLIYVVIGGFTAVVSTDRLQLAFGYIGFSAILALSYVRLVNNGYVFTGIILSLLSLLTCGYLLWLYSRLRDLNPLSFPQRFPAALTLSLIAQIVGLVSGLWLARDVPALDSINLFLSEQQVTNPLSLGWLSLLSLLVANGLWQVVDIATWQRLGSLEPAARSRVNTELAESISFVAIYSGATWALAIFFGMALRHMGAPVESAWTALKDVVLSLFSTGSVADTIYVLILLFAMISIMFSTLDSLISALSYTSYYDLVLGGDPSAGKASLRRARLWTVGYVVVFFAIYKLVRAYVSGVDDILYTFYAFQLALFAAVMASLLRWKRNPLAAVLSIIGGSLLCLIPLSGCFPGLTPYNSAALFSVFGSVTIYLLVLSVRRFIPAVTGDVGAKKPRS